MEKKINKMTNKQRAKVYRQAAEWVQRRNDASCYAIAKTVGVKTSWTALGYFYQGFSKSFPEFYLFKRNGADVRDYWWTRSCMNEHDIKDCRTLALLLSEQIALNP